MVQNQWTFFFLWTPSRPGRSLTPAMSSSGNPRGRQCSAYPSGVQQWEPTGPAMFGSAFRPGLKRLRGDFEREGVEAFAHMETAKKEAMEGLVSPNLGWNRVSAQRGGQAPRLPEADMRTAHDVTTTDSRTAQHKFWTSGSTKTATPRKQTHATIRMALIGQHSSDPRADSTIAPRPPKPATFFNERFMAARHEEGCYEKHILTQRSCSQRAIETITSRPQGASRFKRYGRELVSKPATSLKESSEPRPTVERLRVGLFLTVRNYSVPVVNACYDRGIKVYRFLAKMFSE